MIRGTAALLATVLLCGCASFVDRGPSASAGTEVDHCARWFAQLDAMVDRHGVRDVEADRIAGFAGLRTDRFAASLRDRAGAEPAVFDAWLARLQRLDGEGRGVEIGNLPRGAFPIDGADDAASARARAEHCANAWRTPLQRDAALRATLIARAVVPDRYATWQRAAGLYPLLRWPFLAGVRQWERNHQAAVQRWARNAPSLQRYVFAGPTAPGASIERLWRSRPRDALGLPEFTADETATLLGAYAPALEIESASDADRFGILAWHAGATPAVDTRTPVLYQRIAATRYRGHTLLQLVYSFWFPARPALGRFDLLAGHLDAVVLRITLAPEDGRPLLIDTIHGCGCYHLFMPTAGVTLREGAPSNVEWAYVAAPLPAQGPGARPLVRITALAHDVVGVTRDDGAIGTPYALRADDDLRRLPTPAGGTRSVFGPDGLVAGSERAERFLFWPMGIASAGTMRQWGQHATAFVGRRHFDDADLIERRFVIQALE